ncbi:peptidase S1 and S6 chymotrypsin/Hap [Thecamonas trahens ATCC 50062]|uniref:Peptidase S1 and S6 chymotrypsin/Hap n=1 Tax=Thecamonas trahens ATCC 50062 TaxID=461836 RepID=A0A0L0DDK1_THETB|nr:peptidase S1 and S6 chymotrypsin/Hap [Thecamonas trahens ATCC 50062]KNC50186.1 peptidase S1 and S6 chymotrypsin/Hap [Thecamonas trahens ATCC 50062]|eukprot:XP_013757023.1 peptidase S1 and S6 chymotrypsin/Hap [Thecamonas trahens ATCC 50062]
MALCSSNMEDSVPVAIDLADLGHMLARRQQALHPLGPPGPGRLPATVLYKASVVKVLTTYQQVDFDVPWQSCRPSSCSGSGVCIEGGLILTAAHVVADGTFVQLQKSSDPGKAVADVVAVCHEADLALLKVVDDASPPGFLDDVPRAVLGAPDFLPSLRSKISLVGFPVGGHELSITDGVVSRIEVQSYTHSSRRLLAITVDAAMNSGNSGGPAFLRDTILGIAIQGMDDAQNIGEIVPTCIIHHFLRCYFDGLPNVFPILGIIHQTLEAPQLRRAKGMTDDMTGVLVAKTLYEMSAWERLLPGDVLLAIGGNRIHNNGTVLYAGKFRTFFSVLYHEFYVGDVLAIDVLRDGVVVSVDVELKPYARLVPKQQYDIKPVYFIYGGLVFQPLTRGLLETWDDWRETAPKDLLYHYKCGVRTPELEELVVFSGILSDSINYGYDDYEHAIISSVNGVKVASVRDFVTKLETAIAGGSSTISIRTDNDIILFFDVDEVAAKQPAILDRYKVPFDRSIHLRDE